MNPWPVKKQRVAACDHAQTLQMRCGQMVAKVSDASEQFKKVCSSAGLHVLQRHYCLPPKHGGKPNAAISTGLLSPIRAEWIHFLSLPRLLKRKPLVLPQPMRGALATLLVAGS